MLTTFRGRIFFYDFTSLNGNMGAFFPCDMINEIIKNAKSAPVDLFTTNVLLRDLQGGRDISFASLQTP